MTGYTRQSTPQILPREEIKAGPINEEFNQIQTAFNGSSGHTHTGNTGEAPPINLRTSVVGFLKNVNGGSSSRWNTTSAINPTVDDDSNSGYGPGSLWVNILESRAFLCISASSGSAIWSEITQLVENSLKPSVNNSVDLGSPNRKFKNLHLSGTANLSSISGFSALDNIDASSNSIVNLAAPSNPQDAATKNYVDTRFSNLIDSSPGVLDTLNELAAALGDDPNFATTVSNSIATKLSLSGGQMSGNINMASNRIISLPEPTSPSEPVTKQYSDELYGTTQNALASASNAAQSESNAQDSEEAAALSESNAAQSESNAATSESNAAQSESNAADSASAAALSESNASTSESNAASSASSASSDATTASNAASVATTKASEASTSESNAATSALSASQSENKAQQWAEEQEDTEVEAGEFSAHHWANKAAQSAEDAALFDPSSYYTQDEVDNIVANSAPYISSIDEPQNAVEGTRWFDPSVGITFILVVDDNGDHWVEMGPGGSGKGVSVVTQDEYDALADKSGLYWVPNA